MLRVVILSLIGVGAIAAGSYPVLYPSSATADAVLQRVAEKACRCERSARTKGGQARCWAELDRLIPPGGETMSACLPISEKGRCGPPAGPTGKAGSESPFDTGTCVTTRYDYMSSMGDTILLCSKDEAQAVERAWNKEVLLQGSGGISTPIADRLARDIAAGKPHRPAEGPKSCTG